MKKIRFVTLIGLLVSAAALASGPRDFARQWSVAATPEGAYAVSLTPEVYRQVTQRDLSDLEAFNPTGEPLAFGPMPQNYTAPPGV